MSKKLNGYDPAQNLKSGNFREIYNILTPPNQTTCFLFIIILDIGAS